MSGLRSGKGFRKYMMDDIAIVGPIAFDVEMAIREKEKEQAANGIDDDEDISIILPNEMDDDWTDDIDTHASSSDSMSWAEPNATPPMTEKKSLENTPLLSTPDEFVSSSMSSRGAHQAAETLSNLDTVPGLPNSPEPMEVLPFHKVSEHRGVQHPISELSVTESGATEDEDMIEGRPTGLAARRKRKTGRNREKRKIKRGVEQKKAGTKHKGVTRRRIAESEVLDVSDDFATEGLSVDQSGYAGLRKKLEKTQANLQSEMEVVEWDGRTCRPILDPKGRVISVLGGMPRTSDWMDKIQSAEQALIFTGNNIVFTTKQRENRRTDSPAVSTGISQGGGQKHPMNLALTKRTRALITKHLLANDGFKAIVGFSNRMYNSTAFNSKSSELGVDLFYSYAENTFALYKENLELLLASDPNLTRLFEKSVWSACTFNFGPATATWPHTDQGNLSFGWCAITALGNFNPDLGGHLVLWDLGLIIRFPPGSTILLPSAVLVHSNIPIDKGETRYSLVQYSSGGLFRWVQNGMKSNVSLKKEGLLPPRNIMKQAGSTRWLKGIDMFSKWSDISK
ncbi:hypothetical protein VKT23_020767 [Stygiomarasmius scandens]|uniref:Uncharacterized protein n=1 Tax=Marasmiellus scandens TaxID=2682957 RepID=A0ABR1ILJ6_9AGAR